MDYFYIVEKVLLSFELEFEKMVLPETILYEVKRVHMLPFWSFWDN